MKDFKKFIREAYLGNPLNEEDRATRVDKMLSGEYEDEDYKDSKRYSDVRADLENEMNEDYNRMHNVELNATYKDKLGVKDTKGLTRDDLIQGLKFHDVSMDEYGKPFLELSIAQKQELLSYMNRETEKQFQTDYERRRRGDYSDDREDGMTDYQRGRMDENMGEWPKELTSRYSDEYRFELEKVMSDRAKYRVIDIESGELKGTPVFGTPESLMAYADDLIKPQGGTQSTNLGEDINDPVLMKARASQMKRDKIEADEKAKQAALDKRYGSSFMDKLDAELNLKAELEDLNHEREMIMIDMEEEAEPEGGPIADRYGERLNQIDMRIADIQEELDDLRMYESVNEDLQLDVDLYNKDNPGIFTKADEKVQVTIPGKFGDNEGDTALQKALTKLGKKYASYKVKDVKELNEDDEVNLNVSNANDIADEEEAHSGVLELRNTLKEALKNRLK